MTSVVVIGAVSDDSLDQLRTSFPDLRPVFTSAAELVLDVSGSFNEIRFAGEVVDLADPEIDSDESDSLDELIGQRYEQKLRTIIGADPSSIVAVIYSRRSYPNFATDSIVEYVETFLGNNARVYVAHDDYAESTLWLERIA